MIRGDADNRGFNLVETLVAGVILSGSVLTLSAIGTRAVSEVRLNRHYEVASALMDRQLAMVDYAGIDNFVEVGQAEGVFEEPEPGYRWEIATEYLDVDSLYQVTITISWVEGNRPRSIAVLTRLNGTSVRESGTTSESAASGEQPQP